MDSRGMPCAWARGTWGVPFEGTQAIVSLQLLTCLRRFQVILKYCRTTQARYFAMTSSREPSRPMTNRLLRSAVNCPSSTEPLNCRRHLVKDTLSVSFSSDEVIGDHVLSGRKTAGRLRASICRVSWAPRRSARSAKRSASIARRNNLAFSVASCRIWICISSITARCSAIFCSLSDASHQRAPTEACSTSITRFTTEPSP